MFTQNLFQTIMHQYSYIFIFIVVFYLDRNQGQEKKKEKKLRTYFRITSFSLRTFFVYHIGKFFDGSISKCLPMYLFRIESSLGMFIIVQHFNLTFYSDDHRTSFPCGRLKRVQIDFGKKLNFYMVNNFIWNRFSQSIVHLNSRNSSAKYLAFSR